MNIKRFTIHASIPGKSERWAEAVIENEADKKWLGKRGFKYNHRNSTYQRLLWRKIWTDRAK